jgi:hypothetical protein
VAFFAVLFLAALLAAGAVFLAGVNSVPPFANGCRWPTWLASLHTLGSCDVCDVRGDRIDDCINRTLVHHTSMSM